MERRRADLAPERKQHDHGGYATPARGGAVSRHVGRRHWGAHCGGGRTVGRRPLWAWQWPFPPEPLRLELGRSLALALEFLLGADILRTAVEPTWDEIARLAAIAAIRTGLNYFLQRELVQEAQRSRLELSPEPADALGELGMEPPSSTPKRA